MKHLGDYSTAMLVKVSGTSGGQPVTVTVVQIGVIKGRAELVVSFTTPSAQPFDQTQAQVILDKVNQRLKKAKVG